MPPFYMSMATTQKVMYPCCPYSDYTAKDPLADVVRAVDAAFKYRHYFRKV
jgi:hypothetical protein